MIFRSFFVGDSLRLVELSLLLGNVSLELGNGVALVRVLALERFANFGGIIYACCSFCESVAVTRIFFLSHG